MPAWRAANRLGFALQLTTVRFVGTFHDDPTAVPPAVLATMSRQLGIDTTTDVTGYRAGQWRGAHAAQIRTEHGYRDLADRAARAFDRLTHLCLADHAAGCLWKLS